MSKVYAAINAVQKVLAGEGITKSRTNSAQGFKFRGIDDIYNSISGLLADNGLSILPRYTERSFVERETKNGGTLTFTTVKGEFDFVAAEDGSKHTVVTFGEAQDSGDKSTNKAMSAAFKYAVMQAFAIPTEGDNDADASTAEPSVRKQQPARALVLVGGNQNSKAAGERQQAGAASAGRSDTASPAATGTSAAEESASRKLLRGELAKHGEAEEAVTNKLLDAIGMNGVEDIPEEQLPAALTKLLAYNQKLKAAAKARQEAASATPAQQEPKPAGRQRKPASDLPV